MKGSERKHKQLQKSLEQRLKGYGYKVYTNVEYYDQNKNKVIGEIDILAITTDKDGLMKDIRLYEVKSGSSCYQHAREQLHRARDYFTPNKHNIIPKLVYVTNGLSARIVR